MERPQPPRVGGARPRRDAERTIWAVGEFPWIKRNRTCSSYVGPKKATISNHLEDEWLKPVFHVWLLDQRPHIDRCRSDHLWKWKYQNCLVWENQPLSLNLPSCSCRSLSLWSRRCKGWTMNMNCLFPFFVKYFTFWWEGRSLAQWLGRLWNTLWRFSSSLSRWTTEEEGIRKQKKHSRPK